MLGNRKEYLFVCVCVCVSQRMMLNLRKAIWKHKARIFREGELSVCVPCMCETAWNACYHCYCKCLHNSKTDFLSTFIDIIVCFYWLLLSFLSFALNRCCFARCLRLCVVLSFFYTPAQNKLQHVYSPKRYVCTLRFCICRIRTPDSINHTYGKMDVDLFRLNAHQFALTPWTNQTTIAHRCTWSFTFCIFVEFSVNSSSYFVCWNFSHLVRFNIRNVACARARIFKVFTMETDIPHRVTIMIWVRD